MSADANKALVVQLYSEVFNKGNLELADDLVAADAVNHESSGPDDTDDGGPERLKSVVKMLRTAFPDNHQTVEDLVAEGDKVVARVTLRGTHRGVLLGIPPTGRPVTVTSMQMFRCASGRIVEHWANRDEAGLMRQLSPDPAAARL
jgi:steroid delta-isomerase-like uncharacterized protein